MARFLFATHPITGHVLPALPMVRALADRGHDVRWYLGEKFRGQAEEAGARYVPYREAYDFDDVDYDAAFPGRGELSGINQIRFDFRNVFAKQAGPQHRDLERAVGEDPADVTVGDTGMAAVVTLSERGGPPNAVYNVTCLGVPGRDIAPFGLGMLPTSSFAGRLRNRTIEFLAANLIFRRVSQEITRQCVEIGVRPRKFSGPLLSPYLYLQPTAAAFEYRRDDLPPQVHFIGALLPDPPTGGALPPWWDEVAAKARPVVLVTQGTVATDPTELIGPTLQGLAGDDVLVIAAGVADVAALGPGGVPGNARVERFVPFKPLLPLVDVYVTNGGFGGVQYALTNGVPMVAAGTTEDKPEIGNRISYSGVGINLKTDRPSPDAVAGAVRAVLGDPAYRRRAQLIQSELAAHDAPQEAADLLERLAATGAPVRRRG